MTRTTSRSKPSFSRDERRESNTKSSFLIGAALGLVAGVILAGYARAGTPEAEPIPESQFAEIAGKVRAYLELEGHPAKSPALFPTYTAPMRGRSAILVEGDIILNSNRPEDCQPIDWAHEYAHGVLGRDHGFTPEESERIANDLDVILSADPYLPGCVGPVVVKRIGGMK